MFFKRTAQEKERIKKLEEKQKSAPPLELEKGDLPAIIIAAVLVFGPFMLIVIGLIFAVVYFGFF